MSTVANPSTVSTPRPSLKRRRDSSSNDDDDVCAKQRYFYVLAPESSDYSSDGPESVYSVQAKSTDIAQDTSDTSSKDSWSGSEDRPMFELEVVSLSESDFPFPVTTSSSPEDVGKLSSPVNGPDSQSSRRSAEGSEDEDEGRIKSSGLFTFCRQCYGLNTDPHFMYCVRCHRKRKSFLPERPRGKYKTRRVAQSGSRGGSNSEEMREKKRRDEEEASQDCGVFSQSSTGTLPVDGPDMATNLCQICMTHPRDGGFCHDSIVHVYSCYRCSVRTFRGRGRCPVCNRKPKHVSRIITV